MADTLLITGATGIVGAELVRSLLRHPDPPELRLLIRGEPHEVQAKARWLERFVEPSPQTAAKLRFIRGDVSLPELGLADDDRDQLCREINGIIHSAANTSFHQTREQAERSNVLGVRNVLEFAKRCSALERLGLVSTVYVAGTRTGEVFEDELDLGVGFSNEYERSKAQAEEDARLSQLPISTYRLSIVVGRRSDGRIARLSGAYPIWRLFHQGLMAMIPGAPSQSVDIIPADFAADAIAYLFRRNFRAGANYHVCAGLSRSFTLEDLMPAVAAAIVQAEPNWALHGYPLPAAVTPDVFDDFMATVELVAHRGLRATVRQLRLFTRQLDYPKVFSTTRFEADLASSGLTLEHAREWLPTVVGRAVKHNWRELAWDEAVHE
jgi:nucleoside-diphosphate-sugar epimerase